MKRWMATVVAAAFAWLALPVGLAQDEAARAAASADREAAEERYRQLNSAVEGLMSGNVHLRRQLQVLEDALKRVRADLSSRAPDSSFVTREEFNRLVETVREIDRKREADKQQILEEIANLGKSLSAAIAAANRRPAPAPEPKPNRQPEPDPGQSGASSAAAQEGVWYTVTKDNTLYAIIAAHNEEYRSQGRRTSLKLIQEANPKLKPDALTVGQKIFIPLVSEK